MLLLTVLWWLLTSLLRLLLLLLGSLPAIDLGRHVKWVLGVRVDSELL